MATVQAKSGFYWKGRRIVREEILECTDEEARILAHDGKATIIDVEPQAMMTVQAAPQLVGPADTERLLAEPWNVVGALETEDPKPEAG